MPLEIWNYPVMAVGVAALGAAAAKRISTRLQKQPAPVIWTHSINDDLCVGCSNCVDICPTDVLELIAFKAKVLRFDDCIQCKECERACPTQALKMYREGGQPEPIEVPRLSSYYETDITGLYLIGEAALAPFVKNGVNIGRAVVEHMVRLGGLEPSATSIPLHSESASVFDVLIVGAGPAGLSAGMSCQQYGLSFLIVERGHTPLDTVMHYPDGKELQPMPLEVKNCGLLPLPNAGCSKRNLMETWNAATKGLAACIQRNTAVVSVRRSDDGVFIIETDRGQTYRAQRVVVAVGGGTWRGENAPGSSLPHIQVGLDAATNHRKKAVLVLGGGNSALEAAISLAAPELENRVILAYRGKRADMGASQENRSQLESLEAANRVKLVEGATAVAFQTGKAILKRKGKENAFPCDAVFICYGRNSARPWLEQTIGVRYERVPHLTFRRPATDELVEALLSLPLSRSISEGINDELPTTAYQPKSSARELTADPSIEKTPEQQTINMLFSWSPLKKAQIRHPLPTVAELRRTIPSKRQPKNRNSKTR